MPKDEPSSGGARGVDDADAAFWHLRLYVAGHTARSQRAIANLKAICDTELAGRCDVEVIDLMERPELAAKDQILALPTLVRELPPPVRKIIGDLSATESVLAGLDVEPVGG